MIHEWYPNVNLTRLQDSLTTCRALGFPAQPGLVWHPGYDEPDVYQKYKLWYSPAMWTSRCGIMTNMIQMQDPRFPGISADLEMYQAANRDHADWGRYREVYNAARAVEAMLSPHQIIATQYYESFPECSVFDRRLKRLTWWDQNDFNLCEKTSPEQAAELANDIRIAVDVGRMLADRGRGYMPCITQGIARDYAAPVRNSLASAGIDDVLIWVDASETDVSQIGTLAWKIRPQEAKRPPDPAAMGLMSFDLDVSLLPEGACTSITPTAGTITPTFKAAVPAQVVKENGRTVLRFDPVTKGQGFSANLGRQLSADYTLSFVGLLPSWRANGGTGWQLGPHRFAVSASPISWLWGGVSIPTDYPDILRHVVVCEQTASGKLTILLDGVEVRTWQGPACQPDGTMSIGNVDAMNGYPCKMDLERMTVFEGVNRTKSLSVSRAYADWYGIKWRGGE